MRRGAAVLLVAFALAGAGCHGDPSPTTPTTPETSTIASDVFTGSIAQGGSGFYSFTLTQAATVGLTLGSVTSVSSGKALPAAMTLGLGIPAGTDCAVTSSANVASALSAQVSAPLAAGTYCTRLSDFGNLTEPANFAVRIVATLAGTTPTPPAPITDTFASNLVVRGTTTHAFLLTNGGTLTVTLQSAGPPSTVVIGLGVGIASAGSCYFTRSVEAAAGALAPITFTVDRGQYCVKVYDVGNLTSSVSFSIAIVRP